MCCDGTELLYFCLELSEAMELNAIETPSLKPMSSPRSPKVSAARKSLRELPGKSTPLQMSPAKQKPKDELLAKRKGLNISTYW